MRYLSKKQKIIIKYDVILKKIKIKNKGWPGVAEPPNGSWATPYGQTKNKKNKKIVWPLGVATTL